jgi:hypothetical protein
MLVELIENGVEAEKRKQARSKCGASAVARVFLQFPGNRFLAGAAQ